ncbi:MAG: ATP synthase subunit C [Candidatus Methanomethylicia archaeon]
MVDEMSRKIVLLLLSAGLVLTVFPLTLALKPNIMAEIVGEKYLGAALAIGLSGLGAGIGMGTAAAAFAGALVERPELFGRSLIFIVFIEAIAIYGLVIAFMLLFMG